MSEIPPPSPAATPGRRRLRIRTRITLVATVAVFVVLVLVSVGLLAVMRVGLVRELDRRLIAETELLTAAAARSTVPELARRADLVVQLVSPDGTVISSSSGADVTGERSIAGSPLPWESGSVARSFSVEDPDLGELRVRATPVGDQGRWLVVARSEAQLLQSIRVVRWSLLLIVPIITGGLALVIWSGLGRALHPIEAMRRSASEISEKDLARRLPEPGTGDEIDRLAVTMNAMLDRLDAASQRERQLVADASHELRSPLAAVRALVETRSLAGDDLEAHDAETMAALVRLQSLVESLLELASQDAATGAMLHPVDVDDLVLSQARLLGRTTALTVDTTGVSAGQVLGSNEALRRLVENLGSNAARHARGAVRFSVQEIGGWVELQVGDDGPGIAPADRTRVFERFTRLDEARNADAAGAGLGLAIVAGIVARHRGTVWVDTDPVLGGAVFVVRLPTSGPTPAGSRGDGDGG
jgi:signal transduction histidine kinase